VAIAASAEEISNDKAPTVSSAAHTIRSHEVLSDCDARKRLGQGATDYTIENVHNFERDGLVFRVGSRQEMPPY
jgi:hypothetical protein